jgi:diacylglycerol kinase (ATP)
MRKGSEVGMKARSFPVSLGHAVAGISEAWRSERNFRIHSVFAILVAAAMGVMRPPLLWCAILILTVGLVLVLELVNAALEALVDHLHPEIHPRIKLVKDMAAGAVLVAASASLLIGGLMVVDYLGRAGHPEIANLL